MRSLLHRSTIKIWSKHIHCWAERGSDEKEPSCSRDLHFSGPLAVNPLPELQFLLLQQQDDSDDKFDKMYILRKHTHKKTVCKLRVKWRQNQSRWFSPKRFLFLELQ